MLTVSTRQYGIATIGVAGARLDMSTASEVEQLRQRIHELEQQTQSLQNQLRAAQTGEQPGHIKPGGDVHPAPARSSAVAACTAEHGLSKAQVERYSRQMILPSFGSQAQGRMCRSSVLVVGAGGLGSPAVLYLAAAGIGRLGIADKDTVELSNLHRQIVHTEARQGTHKAESAAAACGALNSSIQVVAHTEGINPSNALELLQQYDIIVDATDNAPTRYLLSDACSIAHKPLVSGAAIGLDGQLTVYCHGPSGPCYRCMFPEAPQAASCSRCSDAGVLGVVPGIVGSLQALEAIKLASGVGDVLVQKLLLFDGAASHFRTVKLRPRNAACKACGDSPSITAESLAGYDYTAFTGQAADDKGPPERKLLSHDRRMTANQFAESLAATASDHSRDQRGGEQDDGERSATSSAGPWQDGALIIDVRPQEQFQMASIPGSINMPFDSGNPEAFSRSVEQIRQLQQSHTSSALDEAQQQQQQQHMVHVVCRRGNDSQLAVEQLHNAGITRSMDLIGGLQGWAQQQDASFPLY